MSVKEERLRTTTDIWARVGQRGREVHLARPASWQCVRVFLRKYQTDVDDKRSKDLIALEGEITGSVG
jgi:hypothetical protein